MSRITRSIAFGFLRIISRASSPSLARLDVVALEGKRTPQRVADRLVVVDYEDRHARMVTVLAAHVNGLPRFQRIVGEMKGGAGGRIVSRPPACLAREGEASSEGACRIVAFAWLDSGFRTTQ